MKSLTIKGNIRENVGKVYSKNLRRVGKVPCVIYGGEKTTYFSAPEISFKKLIYTPNVYTVNIELDNGDNFSAILQDIQFHPVTDKILHLDFYELKEGKEVTMQIPIKLVGSSIGVLQGGVLKQNLRKLKLRATSNMLPDSIEVDISKLDIGHKFLISSLGETKFKIQHPNNIVIVQVRTARNIVKEEEEEEVETEESTEETKEEVKE